MWLGMASRVWDDHPHLIYGEPTKQPRVAVELSLHPRCPLELPRWGGTARLEPRHPGQSGEGWLRGGPWGWGMAFPLESRPSQSEAIVSGAHGAGRGDRAIGPSLLKTRWAENCNPICGGLASSLPKERNTDNQAMRGRKKRRKEEKNRFSRVSNAIEVARKLYRLYGCGVHVGMKGGTMLVYLEEAAKLIPHDVDCVLSSPGVDQECYEECPHAGIRALAAQVRRNDGK